MARPAATPTPGRSGLRALLIAGATAAITAPLAAAQDDPRDGSRVRPADKKAASVLANAVAMSPTVARLIAAIEGSDLFVYVGTAMLKELGLRGMCGTTRIVAATPSGRYVHVSITVPDGDANLVVALAHELQHAVEIASQPEVRSAGDLGRFYRTAGFQKSNGTYCTKEAVKVSDVVYQEVAAAIGSSPPFLRRRNR